MDIRVLLLVYETVLTGRWRVGPAAMAGIMERVRRPRNRPE
jgi:hypothetical protein